MIPFRQIINKSKFFLVILLSVTIIMSQFNYVIGSSNANENRNIGCGLLLAVFVLPAIGVVLSSAVASVMVWVGVGFVPLFWKLDFLS